MPDIKDRIVRNTELLGLTNSWIDSADNKVSIFCAVFSIIYGVITFGIETIKSRQALPDGTTRSAVIALIIISALLMATSLSLYLSAIIPKLISAKKKTNKVSLFYGDIAKVTFEEFREFEKSLTDDRYNKEILSEVYINSKICSAKMKKFKIGVYLSILAVTCSIAALVILIL